MLKKNGSVICCGGREIVELTADQKKGLAKGVTKIFPNEISFAAIKSDGSIITWDIREKENFITYDQAIQTKTAKFTDKNTEV